MATRLLTVALALSTVLGVVAGAPAQASGPPSVAAVTANQIPVPRAPMGWASWNAFASSINFNVIRQQVDAFVASGIPAAG